MASPYENSLFGGIEVLGLFQKILENCIKNKEQPTKETIDGLLGVLEGIRTSESRNIDRTEKEKQFGSQLPYR